MAGVSRRGYRVDIGDKIATSPLVGDLECMNNFLVRSEQNFDDGRRN